MKHKLDWITVGRPLEPEGFTPICECGWEGAMVPGSKFSALKKARDQWQDHVESHFPKDGNDTRH